VSDPGYCLVVGGGFLGRAVARRLATSGSKVRLLTRRPSVIGELGGDAASVLVGDPADPAVCTDAVDGVTAVVWAAGDLIPASAEGDLAAIDDLTPLVTMLETLERRGHGRFVFLSSGGAVYGNPEHLPVKEIHPLRPISIYGAVKVQAERCVQRVGEHSEIDTTVLRCGNAYGPGQRVRSQQGVVANAMDCILRGRRLPVIGGLGSVRDYVYVDDIAAVVEACVRASVDASVLNVGTGEGVSLGELLELIESVAGHTSTVGTAARPADVNEIVLDIGMLRRQLPSFSPTPLRLGLQLTWEAVSTRTPPLPTAPSVGPGPASTPAVGSVRRPR
jgi:UDP-glucose 4-epimerase